VEAQKLSTAENKQLWRYTRSAYAGFRTLDYRGITCNRTVLIGQGVRSSDWTTLTALGLSLGVAQSAHQLGLASFAETAAKIDTTLKFIEAIPVSSHGLIRQYHYINSRGLPVANDGDNPQSPVDTAWLLYYLHKLTEDRHFGYRSSQIISKLAPGLVHCFDFQRNQFWGKLVDDKPAGDHHYDLEASEATLIGNIALALGVLPPDTTINLGLVEPSNSLPVNNKPTKAISWGGSGLEVLALNALTPQVVSPQAQTGAQQWVEDSLHGKGWLSAGYQDDHTYVVRGHGGLGHSDDKPEVEMLVALFMALKIAPRVILKELRQLESRIRNLVSPVLGPAESFNNQTGEALLMPTADNTGMSFMALVGVLQP
jgi:hypothetical protein